MEFRRPSFCYIVQEKEGRKGIHFCHLTHMFYQTLNSNLYLMKRRFISVLLCLMLVSFSMIQAQTLRITGTVTGSEDGLPLPGVSIVVKGTNLGGLTDANGKYELSVPGTAQTLVFSFVGQQT